MEGTTPRTVSLLSAPAVPIGDRGPSWLPLRRELGVKAFGTNAYRADAGETVIEEHVESPGQEELYVVIDGSVRFEVDDEPFELQRGEALFVPNPGARRVGVALSDRTAVLAIGGWPDAAYHSLPWEPIYLARHAARLGEWKRAVEILESESGTTRDSPFVRYHLACAKSRLGDEEAALGELRQAVERNPDLLARAEEDDAFGRLRDHPSWPVVA